MKKKETKISCNKDDYKESIEEYWVGVSTRSMLLPFLLLQVVLNTV